MKVIQHPKNLKFTEDCFHDGNPFSIFLESRLELVLEAGDRAGKVVSLVSRHCPAARRVAAEAVALWFALGERGSGGGSRFSEAELSQNPDRRYSPRTAEDEEEAEKEAEHTPQPKKATKAKKAAKGKKAATSAGIPVTTVAAGA